MEVWGEFKSTRAAVDRLKAAVAEAPDILINDDNARKYLNTASRNLEGTYIVRLFAAFEAALRSYDRWKNSDPTRETKAAIMIDGIGGRRGRGIEDKIRQGAHAVCRVRNYWAHEADSDPGPMSLDDARARLQAYLSDLPDEWG